MVDDLGGGNLSPIVAVVLQGCPDRRLCLGRLAFGVGRSRLQLGGAIQHRVEAFVFDAHHVHPAQEKAWDAGEDERDIVPVAYPGHLDGLVKAGGVQAAQAFPHLVRVQRNTNLLRQLSG